MFGYSRMGKFSRNNNSARFVCPLNRSYQPFADNRRSVYEDTRRREKYFRMVFRRSLYTPFNRQLQTRKSVQTENYALLRGYGSYNDNILGYTLRRVRRFNRTAIFFAHTNGQKQRRPF